MAQRRFRLTNPKIRGQKRARKSLKPRAHTNVTPVWIAEALARADQALASPPAEPHLVRVAPAGKLVQRFVIPLELLPSGNLLRHQKSWIIAKMKERLGLLLFAQSGGKSKAVLPGRPMVRCIRFSSSAPDKYADSFKLAVDKLTGRLNGLGFIRDDRDIDIDLHQTWEPAPPKRGFGLMEVWTGVALAAAARSA